MNSVGEFSEEIVKLVKNFRSQRTVLIENVSVKSNVFSIVRERTKSFKNTTRTYIKNAPSKFSQMERGSVKILCIDFPFGSELTYRKSIERIMEYNSHVFAQQPTIFVGVRGLSPKPARQKKTVSRIEESILDLFRNNLGVSVTDKRNVSTRAIIITMRKVNNTPTKIIKHSTIDSSQLVDGKNYIFFRTDPPFNSLEATIFRFLSKNHKQSFTLDQLIQCARFWHDRFPLEFEEHWKTYDNVRRKLAKILSPFIDFEGTYRFSLKVFNFTILMFKRYISKDKRSIRDKDTT